MLLFFPKQFKFCAVKKDCNHMYIYLTSHLATCFYTGFGQSGHIKN